MLPEPAPLRPSVVRLKDQKGTREGHQPGGGGAAVSNHSPSARLLDPPPPLSPVHGRLPLARQPPPKEGTPWANGAIRSFVRRHIPTTLLSFNDDEVGPPFPALYPSPFLPSRPPPFFHWGSFAPLGSVVSALLRLVLTPTLKPIPSLSFCSPPVSSPAASARQLTSARHHQTIRS